MRLPRAERVTSVHRGFLAAQWPEVHRPGRTKTNGAPGILAGLDARDTHASMNRSTWGKARPEGKRLANSLISNLVPAKLFRANWRSANIGGQQDLQPWPATTKLTGHNSPW